MAFQWNNTVSTIFSTPPLKKKLIPSAPIKLKNESIFLLFNGISYKLIERSSSGDMYGTEDGKRLIKIMPYNKLYGRHFKV